MTRSRTGGYQERIIPFDITHNDVKIIGVSAFADAPFLVGRQKVTELMQMLHKSERASNDKNT